MPQNEVDISLCYSPPTLSMPLPSSNIDS